MRRRAHAIPTGFSGLRPRRVGPASTAQQRRRQEQLDDMVALYAPGPNGRIRLPEVTSSMTVVTVRLPHRLHSPNAWLWTDWRVKKRVKDAWAFRLQFACDRARTTRALARRAFPTPASQVDWVAPTNRPTVIVSRHVPSRRNFMTDRDDRVFAAKALIDTFVKGGFLPNDRETDIDLDVEQVVSADGLDWTIVTIDSRPLELRQLPTGGRA